MQHRTHLWKLKIRCGSVCNVLFQVRERLQATLMNRVISACCQNRNKNTLSSGTSCNNLCFLSAASCPLHLAILLIIPSFPKLLVAVCVSCRGVIVQVFVLQVIRVGQLEIIWMTAVCWMRMWRAARHPPADAHAGKPVPARTAKTEKDGTPQTTPFCCHSQYLMQQRLQHAGAMKWKGSERRSLLTSKCLL